MRRKLAEANDNGTILRDYVWIEQQRNYGLLKADTSNATGAATPLAVINDPENAAITTYIVPDHLDRPTIGMDGTGNIVWEASYKPFDEVHGWTLNEKIVKLGLDKESPLKT